MPLTTLGKNEAAQGATQMWKDGYQVDVAFTSLLKRAQQTLAIVLKITGQEDVPVHQNWRWLYTSLYGNSLYMYYSYTWTSHRPGSPVGIYSVYSSTAIQLYSYTAIHAIQHTALYSLPQRPPRR